MKAFTDLEQSKKLAKILPIESADMLWGYYYNGKNHCIPNIRPFRDGRNEIPKSYIPAWSLTALISVLPKEVEIDGQCYAPCLFPVQDKWLLKLWYNSNHTFTSPIAIFSDNPVDAYVAMIEKLHELKML